MPDNRDRIAAMMTHAPIHPGEVPREDFLLPLAGRPGHVGMDLRAFADQRREFLLADPRVKEAK